MQIFLFLRLSIVKHFPKVAVQTKKATLEGIFCFQMLFQGKQQSLISIWLPPHIILPKPFYYRAIYSIHEARHGLQFPNMKTPKETHILKKDLIRELHKLNHTCLLI